MKTLVKRTLFLNLSILIIFVFNAGCQQQKPDASLELKPVIDKLVEIWNNGNLDDLDTIINSNFVRSMNQIPDVKGVDGLKKVITAFRTAYPDLRITFDNEIFSKNSGAGRWTFSGTNTGSGEMPPTGKSVSIWGESIFHFADGKITREIVAYNNEAFMEQLGFTMIPPSGTAK